MVIIIICLGYTGDEGYMVLNNEVENEPLPNNYFITNFFGSGLTTDYSRHVTGHSRILGVSYDGYPIYGPYGYNSSGTAVRQTSSYRLRSGTEIQGSREKSNYYRSRILYDYRIW